MSTRRGCGRDRRRIIETKAAAEQAAITATMSHGGEHTIERCKGHWHVRRVERPDDDG